MYKDIRKPALLEKLLQALALQIGSEVAYTELATLLQVNKVTVENYIQWKAKGNLRFPKTFTEAYPESTTLGVTRENFEAFIN